jgi:type I restriction enzyme S subunit
MRNISQEKVKKIKLGVPALDEQRRIAAEIDRQLTLVAALAAELKRARRRGAWLRRSILEHALGGMLTHQDPNDEPASLLLERIAAGRGRAPKAQRRHRKVRA